MLEVILLDVAAAVVLAVLVVVVECDVLEAEVFSTEGEESVDSSLHLLGGIWCSTVWTCD